MASTRTEELINKVGGRFMLVALMQKRIRELKKGSKPLIDYTSGKTEKDIAIEEIAEGKITLTPYEPQTEDYFDIEEDLFDIPD